MTWCEHTKLNHEAGQMSLIVKLGSSASHPRLVCHIGFTAYPMLVSLVTVEVVLEAGKLWKEANCDTQGLKEGGGDCAGKERGSER